MKRAKPSAEHGPAWKALLIAVPLLFAIIGVITSLCLLSHRRHEHTVIPDAVSNAQVIRMIMECRKADTGTYGPVGVYAWMADGARPANDLLPSLQLRKKDGLNAEVKIIAPENDYLLTITDHATGQIEFQTNAIGEILFQSTLNRPVDRHLQRIHQSEDFLDITLVSSPLIGILASLVCLIGARRGRAPRLSGLLAAPGARTAQFWGIGAVLWSLSFLNFPQAVTASIVSLVLHRRARGMSLQQPTVYRMPCKLALVLSSLGLAMAALTLALGIFALRYSTHRF